MSDLDLFQVFGSATPFIIAAFSGLGVGVVSMMLRQTAFRIFAILAIVLLQLGFWLQSQTVTMLHKETLLVQTACQEALKNAAERVFYATGLPPEAQVEDYRREFPQCWPPKK